MLRKLMNFYRKVFSIAKEQEELKLMMGQLLAEQLKGRSVNALKDAEFKVFSQGGDDGIIQYLVNQAVISSETFIEFGVESYKEANTRFLLLNNNWRGLIMDGSEENIAEVRREDIYWKYELTAKAAFITQENINQLIEGAGFKGEIGLLHIDVDGVDWWIWKAIKAVSPDIVVVEYNSVFGIERAITVPYAADFIRSKAHFSHLFWGTSLLSLCDLAEEKGYYFVGCNKNGNNAYFVRKDRIGSVKPVMAADGFVCSRYRESRNVDGALTYITGNDRIECIRGLQVYNTRTNEFEVL